MPDEVLDGFVGLDLDLGASEGLVKLVDVSLMVLRMVDFHGSRVDMGLKGVVSEW